MGFSRFKIMPRRWLSLLATATLVVVAGMILTAALQAGYFSNVDPRRRHFAANGNFDPGLRYLPGKAGFNLADVSSLREIEALPADVEALVWLGQCDGASERFKRSVEPYLGLKKVFGFYLMDDPDPTGRWNQLCPAGSLKAQSDYIHQRMPHARTFIAMMNLSSSREPTFMNSYNHENTHVDLFGIAPYPCRVNAEDCDLDMINRFVEAAVASGITLDRIVPTYQTFGDGGWRGDDMGRYRLPVRAELAAIMDRWATLVASPEFDFAYSWGRQRNDKSLARASDLQELLRDRFKLGSHAIGTTPTKPNASLAETHETGAEQ